MRKCMKERAIQLSCFVFFLLLCVAMCLGSFTASPIAYAATDGVLQYDQTDVLDDLESMTIDGKPFDIRDWAFSEEHTTTVVMFTEYCYSFYSNKQGNYGLYVYVWNPRGLAYSERSTLNMVQLSAGNGERYEKYPLRFLSKSERAGYEGLFYKFKVALSGSEKERILSDLNSSERVYHVSGIELLVDGERNATDYTVNLAYTYSGYADGYGSVASEGDTLTCTTEQGEVLTLDVYSTFYRPDGVSGDIATQDTLHSVYFAVPNDVLAKYGALTAVHATWLNALTAPIFVTGNETIYNALLPFLGDHVDGGKFQYVADDNANTALPYALIASKYAGSSSWNEASYSLSYLSYNANRAYTVSDSDLYTLCYAFLAEDGNADDYILSAEALLDYFTDYTGEHGGELVNDKYSRALFESVDNAFTDVNIRADDTFSLTDATIDRNWWESWLGTGGTIGDSQVYDGIPAIQAIDFETDFDVAPEAFCDAFYIADSDYNAFYSFCEEMERNNRTVFLLRYMQTEYTSYEVVEYERGEGDWTLLGTEFGYEFIDTNAYFAQEWVQLDFDIIDVTFTNGSVDTIIPVVSSPIDAVADITPPVIITDDDGSSWWQIMLAVLLVVLLAVLLYKFFRRVFSRNTATTVVNIGEDTYINGKRRKRKK